MADAVPCVYILNGEDDYAIEQAVAEMLASLGDPVTADMNTTRLDGATYNPDQLLTVAGAMPFLARRRLVILTNPLAKLNSEPAREKFRGQLEKIPASTALVLVHNKLLTSKKDLREKKLHWLERWAQKHPERALVKTFPAPEGPEMIERLIKMARAAGGSIDPDAADLLAGLMDGNLRVAALEIDKLLAYVNYKHPIHFEDVQAVTADINQGDVFELVDALSARNGQRAMGMLTRLMEYNSYYELFGMIVRQFRLLILAREVIDQGGRKEQIQAVLSLHPFVAGKLDGQARRFQMNELEEAYRRLVQVDETVKTSQAPEALALEYFISAFIAAPEQSLV
jgi:DNA polymerase-3 subunit delta